MAWNGLVVQDVFGGEVSFNLIGKPAREVRKGNKIQDSRITMAIHHLPSKWNDHQPGGGVSTNSPHL